MRAVFFDLDGTLVELPDDFGAVFESAMDAHGVSVSDDHLERYSEAFFEYLGECHPDPYRMAMADLREEFGFEPDAEALAETYADREAAATDLRPGVREVLDALDCPVGVLTNGAPRVQHRKLAHHEIAQFFDAAVISGEVGAGKPDPEIFAAGRDAIEADEYAFVADDLERDVLPAQKAGFTGVYLADEAAASEADAGETNTGEADTDANGADAIVTSLREVPSVL